MDGISILDERGSQPDRRRPLAPFGNGKSGWVMQAVTTAVLSAITAFAIALWTASGQAKSQREATELQIRTGLAVIEERQKNQNEEVMRAIENLRADIREMNRGRR